MPQAKGKPSVIHERVKNACHTEPRRKKSKTATAAMSNMKADSAKAAQLGTRTATTSQDGAVSGSSCSLASGSGPWLLTKAKVEDTPSPDNQASNLRTSPSSARSRSSLDYRCESSQASLNVVDTPGSSKVVNPAIVSSLICNRSPNFSDYSSIEGKGTRDSCVARDAAERKVVRQHMSGNLQETSRTGGPEAAAAVPDQQAPDYDSVNIRDGPQSTFMASRQSGTHQEDQQRADHAELGADCTRTLTSAPASSEPAVPSELQDQSQLHSPHRVGGGMRHHHNGVDMPAQFSPGNDQLSTTSGGSAGMERCAFLGTINGRQQFSSTLSPTSSCLGEGEQICNAARVSSTGTSCHADDTQNFNATTTSGVPDYDRHGGNSHHRSAEHAILPGSLTAATTAPSLSGSQVSSCFHSNSSRGAGDREFLKLRHNSFHAASAKLAVADDAIVHFNHSSIYNTSVESDHVDHDPANGDWNGFWIPVVSDDHHNVQSLLSRHQSTDGGSSKIMHSSDDGLAGPYVSSGSSCRLSMGADGHGSNTDDTSSRGDIFGSISKLQHSNGSNDHELAAAQRSLVSRQCDLQNQRSSLLEPIDITPTSRSFEAFYSAECAHARATQMSLHNLPCSSPAGSGNSVLHDTSTDLATMSHSASHMQSPSCPQDVDFCESLLNVDLNQHHLVGNNTSHPQQSHMGISSMLNDRRMTSLDAVAHDVQSAAASSTRTTESSNSSAVRPENIEEQRVLMDMDHHNLWMPMDQWMDSSHTTQLSSSLVHHRDSPSVVVHDSTSVLGSCSTPPVTEHQWSGNNVLSTGPYPICASPHVSLGADYLARAPTSSFADNGSGFPYMHLSRDPVSGSHSVPSRSLSNPDMASARLQPPLPGSSLGPDNLAHLVTLESPPMGIGSSHLARSLSTSALDLHSEPDGFDMISSRFHDDTVNLYTRSFSGPLIPVRSNVGRRNCPPVKRSLSFIQSAEEEAGEGSPSKAKVSKIASANTNEGNRTNPMNHHSAASISSVETAPTGTAVAGGLQLAIGKNSGGSCNAANLGVQMGSTFRPGIDDAAAQLSALLYTKSQTDIGNNAISQYHKLAFQNSFYNNASKVDDPSSTSPLAATGMGIGAKTAARRRHGTATDPQSIAARTRRERFSDRIRILQSLVPNGERLDTVSMLGQTLEYVRFLQQQVWQLYNGTPAPLSGSAGAGSTATTSLAAQVASAESLAASFLSSMAQRQAAAAAHANSTSSQPGSETGKLAGGADKWKLTARGSGLTPHVPAECPQVA